MGALVAGAGQDTGKASRAGQAAMAGQETREAMALFFQVAKAGQGAPWPWT